MTATILGYLSKIANPAWLTGPIFDKELRVSSRRRRNYVLRFGYIAVLTIYITLVWLSVHHFSSPAGPTTALKMAQMSVTSMAVISAIAFFQFITTQLLAVIMLSTAISDEIYHRTLGLLMTTPINSFQIVVGKLLSKLLQLILLIAISLPLLAVLRVFGGVPWGYVVSSLCVTLTAVLFAGLLSLYFSISSRRAYVVILKTVFTLGLLYGFVPAITVTLLRKTVPENILAVFLVHLNPLALMMVSASSMISPTGLGPISFFSWPLHCGIMLAASGLVLARSVKIVRRVALRQAVGQFDYRPGKNRREHKQTKSPARAEPLTGAIRPVKGSPVVWKEIRAPIIRGPDRTNGIIGLIASIIALQITYAVCIREDCLDKESTHTSYVMLFVFIGLAVNMVLSATSITSEKEARSWPILLATPLDDWHILLGKAVGVIRRCLPVWFLLAGHVVLFVAIRYIHPVAMLYLVMLVGSMVAFLSGSGLYFSALLKRTTSAVVANFALAVVLWAVIPLVLGLVAQIIHEDDSLNAYISAHPIVQAAVIMGGTAGEYNATKRLSALRFRWPYGDIRIVSMTAILATTTIIYTVAGFVFAWRAKCRFRRNIF